MCSLSIIIPAYNVERYIIELLSSLRNQRDVTGDQYEVIVVNDGSTDGTLTSLSEFKNRFPDFNLVVKNQDNKGVSCARNNGLAAAKGDYVWFIDSDDIIANNAVSEIIGVLKEHNVDIVRMGHVVEGYLNENGLKEDYVSLTEKDKYSLVNAYELYLGEQQFGHTRFVWRHKLLIDNQLCYPENVSNNEDYLFLIMSISYAGTAYVNNTMQYYIYRELSASLSRGKRSDFRFIDKHLRNKLFVLESAIIFGERHNSTWTDQKQSAYDHVLSSLKISANDELLFCEQPISFIRYYLMRLKALKCFPSAPQFHQTAFRRLPYTNTVLFICVSQILRSTILKKILKRIA